MRRPRFSIRTLLWLTLVVAAFLGGMAFEREQLERERVRLELEAQAREIDRLMARFNALMNADRKLDAEVLPGPDHLSKREFMEKMMVRPALEEIGSAP
jgi:hypothetical protein